MKFFNKENLKKKRVLAGIALLCVAIIGVIIIVVIQNKKQYNLDKAAKEGEMLMESMQEKANKDNFRFQILAEPMVTKGDNKVELMITNPLDNKYKTSVVITLDESQEEIYTSKVLNPGDRERYITLEKELEVGTYDATAMFTIIDLETDEFLGQVAAQLQITVKN